MEEYAKIAFGILLTSLVGGFLGYVYQRRLWENQNEQRLSDEESRRADELSQALSRLLDKRLYRMLRLFYASRAVVDGRGQPETARECLAEYNAVLYEWNDSLNANLALIGAYYGERARDWLFHEVYGGYQGVGQQLEEFYLRALGDDQVSGSASAQRLAKDLNGLNDNVYRLNVFMMTQLRGGQVGRSAPDPLPNSVSPAAVIQRGVPLAGIDANQPEQSSRRPVPPTR